MLNMWSGAGTVEAYDAESPLWADLGGGYQYAIVLSNQTDDPIPDAGGADVTLELWCADAEEPNGNPRAACTPGPWRKLLSPLGCDSVLAQNLQTADAEITLTEHEPIPAHSQCSWSAPCPCQFMQVTGVPAGLHVIVVVTRLKRTGGPMIPPMAQHP